MVVICVDGLGGHPDTTFGLLQKELEQDGHTVLILDTSRVQTHEDRIRLVLCACSKHPTEDVVLVGQSAGGSAVRVAAERLERQGKRLAGVILLSPAMPFGIPFMTMPLLRVMAGRLAELFLGKDIFPTKEEFGTLTAPLAPEVSGEAVAMRQSIPGREARTLAFAPPKFVGYTTPTHYIFGKSDAWVAPRAHIAFATKIGKHSKTTVSVLGSAGHLTLASENRHDVAKIIQKWIADLTSS